MTDRFLVHVNPVIGPATHAVVIGVGAYRHLPGGTGKVVRKPDGLGQLSSPPVSARAVADFLITSPGDSAKPLADVALLLAERRPTPYLNPLTGASFAVEEATIDNLETALSDWFARGDAGEDHRLLLYFCGHGVARPPDVTLLASDYGAKLNALDGAIDFRTFVQGMESCKAREQVYFVDACRASSDTLLKAGRANGRPIVAPDLDARPATAVRAPVFYSTLLGASAYAQEGKVSPFTAALLQGLAGAGADDSEGDWRVGTNRLKEAIDFFMTRATRGIGQAQVPATDSQAPITLARLANPPTVVAIVTCDPAGALAQATLSYAAGGVVTARPRRTRAEWEVELPVGQYEFRAEFGAGPWVPRTEARYITPVYKKVNLRVQP